MQTFNVKDGSLHEFFRQHTSADVGHSNDIRERISAYYLMKDQILVRKSALFSMGLNVTFELVDIAKGSNVALVSRYVYVVAPYDDVQYRLELVRHTITGGVEK